MTGSTGYRPPREFRNLDQLDEIPTRCTNKACEGDELTWELSTVNLSGVGSGQLTMHDIHPILVLGCDECGETVAIVHAGPLVDALVRRPPARVEVVVVATLKQVRRWEAIERYATAVLDRIKPSQVGSLGQEALAALQRAVNEEE